MKKTLATLGAVATIGTGGIATVDQIVINPYTNRGTHYELETAHQFQQGERVEIRKDKAEFTIKGWNDEYSIKITPQVPKNTTRLGTANRSFDKRASRPLFSKQMQFRESNITAFIEPRTGDGNEFDIDFTLHSKPNTNIFTYTVEGAENFDFFYQPPMTEDPLRFDAVRCTETQCFDEEGLPVHERPENVVGSYAVYHKTKVHHKVGDTNYATGKILHIYRPKAIDANGNEVWAELNYADGILSVTVPQEFLDKAKYPIIVDPTFGRTTIGSSSSGVEDRIGAFFNGGNFDGNTISTDGRLVSVSFSLHGGSLPSDYRAKGVVYEGTSTSTVDVVATTSESVNPGLEVWTTVAVTNNASLSSSNRYTPAVWGDCDGSCNIAANFDNASGRDGFANVTYTGTFPDPQTFTGGSGLYSVYATYDDLVAETQTPSNVASTSAQMNGNISFIVGASDIGFIYGIDSVFSATTTVKTATSSIGTFSTSTDGLTTFEEYGHRAFASSTVSDSFSYGDTYQFFTADISTSTPVVAADNHAWDLSSFSNGTNATTTTSGTSLVLDNSSGSFLTPTLLATTTHVQVGFGTGATDITLPGTPTEGDLIIVYGGGDCNNAGNNIGVNTSGYTNIYRATDNIPNAVMAYKVMGGTPDTTVNVNPSDCDPNARDTAWIIELWSNVDTNTPIDATATTADGGTGMPNSPSITTVTDGAFVITAGFLDDDDIATAVTPPSGYSNTTAEDSNGSPAGITIMTASKEVVSASSENPGVFGGGGNDQWHAVTAALRPERSYEDGKWTSPAWSVGSITDVGSSHIEFASTTPSDTSVVVKTAVNSSAVTAPGDGDFTTVTSGGSIAGVSANDDLTGKYVWVRVELNASTDGADTPTFTDLIMGINEDTGGGGPAARQRVIIIGE